MPPKQRKRAVRLLATRKRPPATTRAITARNATDSRLLALPAELRNRIYGYVLSGQVLHINSAGHLSVVCISGMDTTAAAKDYEASKITRDLKLCCTLHQRCLEADQQYSTALVQVCREINTEAALLPFSGNTFAMRMAGSLGAFLEGLLIEQRKAITSLHLQHNATIGRIARLGGNVTTHLTGLRHVTVGMSCYDFPRMRDPLQPQAEQIRGLGRGQLETASIMLIRSFPHEKTLGMGPENWQVWAKELERVLKLPEKDRKEDRDQKQREKAERFQARETKKTQEKEVANHASAARRERRGLRQLH
ncbi:hypothetical protein AC579_5728 [Pseudocercospora musae]|uniref:DUF7730 domain-containing protein n=1 Tax=Pseudocercospora musae TaxID=113226 RepID=A0A139ISB2_9PEZI|nr:hypothetical protein AC579_5728 [Pseudocercospora musae]